MTTKDIKCIEPTVPDLLENKGSRNTPTLRKALDSVTTPKPLFSLWDTTDFGGGTLVLMSFTGLQHNAHFIELRVCILKPIALEYLSGRLQDRLAEYMKVQSLFATELTEPCELTPTNYYIEFSKYLNKESLIFNFSKETYISTGALLLGEDKAESYPIALIMHLDIGPNIKYISPTLLLRQGSYKWTRHYIIKVELNITEASRRNNIPIALVEYFKYQTFSFIHETIINVTALEYLLHLEEWKKLEHYNPEIAVIVGKQKVPTSSTKFWQQLSTYMIPELAEGYFTEVETIIQEELNKA